MAELDTNVSALHPAPTSDPPPCASDGIRSGRVQGATLVPRAEVGWCMCKIEK